MKSDVISSREMPVCAELVIRAARERACVRPQLKYADRFLRQLPSPGMRRPPLRREVFRKRENDRGDARARTGADDADLPRFLRPRAVLYRGFARQSPY